MIKMIIATSDEASNFAIGKGNKLLWYVPEDLSYFKQVTQGCRVIMGGKTMRSLPFKNGLPSRENVVLSRSKDYPDDITVMDKVELVYNMLLVPDNKDTFVIGGAEVYELMLPFVDQIHHTTVEGSYPDADTHFNMDFLDNREWVLYSEEVLCDRAIVKVYNRKEDL